MRTLGIIILWFGLGYAVTDLVALAMEQILTTAPMHELLAARHRASAPNTARADLTAPVSHQP
ncbi:MAG: hypothetical protein J0H44_19680 [Alphaproteobacteria bacterium]|nr:hypothetical protein [Alphaproteobacteria bacterium]